MLALAYIKLVALSFIQDSMIFRPHPRGTAPIKQPQEYGLNAEERTIATEDGETIYYWLGHPTADKPYVVFFHGNSGHFGNLVSATEAGNDTNYRLKLIKALMKEGYGIIAVSHRGFGKSTGKSGEAGFVRDVMAVSQMVVKSKMKVFVLGESLGCFSALKLTDILTNTDHSPQGVALIAPFSDLLEKIYETDERFRKLDVKKFMRHNFDNRSIINSTNYRGKMLIIHPLEDKVSGVYHTKILQGAAEGNNIPVEVVILKDAGHVSWNPEEVAKIITDRF